MSHILLVDDNEDDREFVENFVAEKDCIYTIHSVENGFDALEHLNANTVDCVLLDYRLDNESGIDVLVEIKVISPLMPVIMLTGQGDEDVAASSIKNGAADYLIKQHLNKTGLLNSISGAIDSARLAAKITEQEYQQRVFLITLVHDIRAPLRNIHSISKMLLEESDPEEISELLHLQSDAAKRATDLINTLESYSLLDGDVPFDNVSLTEIANDAIKNLSQVINQNHADIVIHDMPNVYGNTSQLTQLFQNLIHNGIKYCDNKRPAITVECQSIENTVTIVVKDKGIGIPKEHLKTIFAPLTRLWGEEKYKGTGLGLAICQKIVERHKGTIWCDSIEGEGSTFYVRLPKMQK